ncbi:MAG: NAD-dependent epimerase/dehydratase family protein [Planctomycetota bacterium]
MAFQGKVLVTGGAGYLGSVIVETLLAQGAPVVVLDNLTYSAGGIAHLLDHPGLELIEGDIRDPVVLARAVANVRCVIHLAAIANDPSGALDPELTRSVNYEAYFTLLDAARRAGVQRFLNASSFSVYGCGGERELTEEHPLNPLKEYSVCKALSEEVVRNFASPEFITTSLRCATICGWSRRMRFDLIANTLTAHAVKKRHLIVMGGDQERPQIHIQDLADLFIALLEAPPDLIRGDVFNAGGPNVSILEIAELARNIVGHHVELELAPPRHDERSYHVSSEKLSRVLGLRARRDLGDAMRGIVHAYQQGWWQDPEEARYHNVRWMTRLRSGGCDGDSISPCRVAPAAGAQTGATGRG